jgi:ABC-2 type transport system permease protein
VVLCQDALIDEKQSGITEWLLSKPVSRQAYILAKLVTHAVYTVLFLVAIPAGVTYGLLSLRGAELFPFLPFMAGVGLMILHLLFYASLTIMLGAWFNSRAPLVAISLGLLFGGGFIGGFIKPLLYVTPWLLPQLASGLASGLPLPLDLVWPPVVATTIWVLIFIFVALVKFERTEF